MTASGGPEGCLKAFVQAVALATVACLLVALAVNLLRWLI